MNIQRRYLKATRQLANLNRDLAAKMILLASQTGDTAPLVQAVEALQKADELFSTDNTPHEMAEIRQALAETLFTLGKAQDDIIALERSVEAYRSAITLASLLGDNEMRKNLKKNYDKVRKLVESKSGISRSAIRGAA